MRTTHSTCRQYLLFGPKSDGILDEMALGGGGAGEAGQGRGRGWVWRAETKRESAAGESKL